MLHRARNAPGSLSELLQCPIAKHGRIHDTGILNRGLLERSTCTNKTKAWSYACRHAITLPNTAAMPTADAQDHLFSPRMSTAATAHNTDNQRVDIMDQLLWSAEGSPRCSSDCEARLLRMVSLHIRSRGIRNLQAATLLIRTLSELYDSFLAGQNRLLAPISTTPSMTCGDALYSTMSHAGDGGLAVDADPGHQQEEVHLGPLSPEDSENDPDYYTGIAEDSINDIHSLLGHQRGVGGEDESSQHNDNSNMLTSHPQQGNPEPDSVSDVQSDANTESEPSPPQHKERRRMLDPYKSRHEHEPIGFELDPAHLRGVSGHGGSSLSSLEEEGIDSGVSHSMGGSHAAAASLPTRMDSSSNLDSFPSHHRAPSGHARRPLDVSPQGTCGDEVCITGSSTGPHM